jgi:glycosyltransferase involved in cell wall biosynthesis
MDLCEGSSVSAQHPDSRTCQMSIRPRMDTDSSSFSVATTPQPESRSPVQNPAPAARLGPGPDGSLSVPDYSVIVPAYRGKATIINCVGSLRQMAADLNLEIVVVESSGDGSAELVRERFPDVRVICSPSQLTAGQARNLGIHHARGRWIFCVDQDCLVPHDWIPRLLQHLQQPGVGAAGGSLAVANPDNLSGWCVYFLEFLNHFPGRRNQVRTNNFLIGANSCWRPEVFTQVAFPDQTLGEDLLLSEMVRAQGYDVIYDPSITVRHHNRSGWSEFRRYCLAMGKSAAKDQQRIGGFRINLVNRWPLLIFAAPLMILPRIGWALRSAPPSYLLRYLLLLPCCFYGQLVWASAFRATLLADHLDPRNT